MTALQGTKKAREARRLAAEARQAAYDALTAEQKLARTFERSGNSGRERARLSGDPQAKGRIKRGKKSDYVLVPSAEANAIMDEALKGVADALALRGSDA